MKPLPRWVFFFARTGPRHNSDFIIAGVVADMHDFWECTNLLYYPRRPAGNARGAWQGMPAAPAGECPETSVPSGGCGAWRGMPAAPGGECLRRLAGNACEGGECLETSVPSGGCGAWRGMPAAPGGECSETSVPSGGCGAWRGMPAAPGGECLRRPVGSPGW